MRTIPSFVTAAALGTVLSASTVDDAHAGCSPEIYIGTVCFMATDYCPRGYIPANGQQLAIADHAVLYSLYGSIFGGNDVSFFNVPDLRGRSVVGVGTGLGLTQVTRGMKRGEPTFSLADAHMPFHYHDIDLSGVVISAATLRVSDQAGTLTSPHGHYLAQSTKTQSPQYKDTGTSVLMAANMLQGGGSATVTSVTGNGASFNIQGPRLGLTACIADGSNLYPPRP